MGSAPDERWRGWGIVAHAHLQSLPFRPWGRGPAEPGAVGVTSVALGFPVNDYPYFKSYFSLPRILSIANKIYSFQLYGIQYSPGASGDQNPSSFFRQVFPAWSELTRRSPEVPPHGRARIDAIWQGPNEKRCCARRGFEGRPSRRFASVLPCFFYFFSGQASLVYLYLFL